MQLASYNIQPLINSLIKEKKDFVLKKTNSSIILIYKGDSYAQTMPFFKKRHLYLFKAIKTEILRNIEENNISVKNVNYNEINYYLFDKEKFNTFYRYENVVEYDITKAYLKTALNMGFITKDFFNLVAELPKKIRLILLGSIASTKIIEYYENGKLKSDEHKNDKFLTNVWLMISQECGRIMCDLLNIPGFLFFWFDGIYFDVTKTNIEFLRKEIKKLDMYEFHEEKIEFIQRHKNFVVVKKNGELKQFYFTNIKKKDRG